MLLILLSIAAVCYASIVHETVSNAVLVRSNVERWTVSVSLTNTAGSPAEKYFVALRDQDASRFSYGIATFESGITVHFDAPFSSHPFTDVAGDTQIFSIDFPSPLQPQANLKVTLKLVFTHPVQPVPEHVSMYDGIFVRYNSNAVFYSPYKTKQSKTTIETGSSSIVSFTETYEASKVRDKISYSVKEIGAFSVRPVILHFKAEKPFVTMKTMVKEIEISQWGNVAIEEHYIVQNTAATLKGSFSRLDYSKPSFAKNNAVSFENLIAGLPRSAFNIYYRDKIGNISTSSFQMLSKNTMNLNIKPRFPIMPGWKTDFYIGYSIPSQELLFREVSSNRLVLDTKFGSPFKNVVVDDLTVRVILPEGASDIESFVPFNTEQREPYLRYTYLDFTGRPVIEFHIKNAVGFHNKNFQVTYAFPSFFILREPLYLITGFFLFYICSMIYVRISLSLDGGNSPPSSASVLMKLHEQLLAIYESEGPSSSAALKAFTALNSALDSAVGPAEVLEDLKRLEKELNSVLSRGKSNSVRNQKAQVFLDAIKGALSKLKYSKSE